HVGRECTGVQDLWPSIGFQIPGRGCSWQQTLQSIQQCVTTCHTFTNDKRIVGFWIREWCIWLWGRPQDAKDAWRTAGKRFWDGCGVFELDKEAVSLDGAGEAYSPPEAFLGGLVQVSG